MESDLKRKLGLFSLTTSGVGLILGAGIYAIIGEAAGLAGPQLWLSFLIGAFISSFTGLTYAELATTIPKAAAEYNYVQTAFQNNLGSYLVGWTIIMTESFASATVALAFAGYLQAFINISVVLIALILLLILSIINFLGIEFSSRLNIIFTIIEAFGLILVIYLGLPKIGSVNYSYSPLGLSGVLQGSALIFFAYIGFEDIANLAEETKEPEKNIPRAFIISIVTTAILYVLVSVSAVSLLDWKLLSESSAPLADAAAQVLGDTSFVLLSVIALFATSNTVLILLIVCSRTIFGMARERRMPRLFSKVSKRGTPTLAVALSFSLAGIFSLLENLGLVAEISNLGTFITFASVNLSAIWMRIKYPDLDRPFKTPFTIGKIPLIPLIGLFSSTLLITQLRYDSLIYGAITIVFGFIFYRFCKTGLAKGLECNIEE
jgi:basic amino acid/polyamine antiporter, APA family